MNSGVSEQKNRLLNVFQDLDKEILNIVFFESEKDFDLTFSNLKRLGFKEKGLNHEMEEESKEEFGKELNEE